MFHNQNDEFLENKKPKYLELYEEWKEKRPEQSQKRGPKHYIDGDFFQWVVLKYKEEGKYKEEFGELIDILIRKNLTSKKYIRYEPDLKHEMYSSAIYMIFKYTINGFDPQKASAFVFFTSAINNAFYRVLKEYYNQKNVAKEIIRRHRVDAIAYNYEPQHVNDIEQELKKHYDFIEGDEEVIGDINNVIYSIKEKYGDKVIFNKKIIENENAPRFRRKYITYQAFIPTTNDSGVFVEYFYLPTTNESSGTRPNELMNRAIKARELGYQYFAFYSDELDIGKDTLLEKLDEIVTMTEINSPEKTGREVRFDYIPTDEFKNSEIEQSFWYGLKEDRKRRFVVVDQSPESYMKWLDNEENATRVYSFGRLKG